MDKAFRNPMFLTGIPLAICGSSFGLTGLLNEATFSGMAARAAHSRARLYVDRLDAEEQVSFSAVYAIANLERRADNWLKQQD